MQRFLHESMNAIEGTELDPDQHYPDTGNTQYGGVQYDFQPDANEFTNIDHNLNIDPSFHSARSSGTSTLGGHITIPVQNGRVGSVSPATAAAHHNSSIHHPNVPPSPPVVLSNKRKSQEDSLDSGAAGDSKRRRSKVSRACDQCRKKKIRCDADAEGSGQLKTCSNCVKAGQTCDYSRIPQKRGPSKGYIKELSERVQQVEGQLALQNSASYRSSFDGPANFGETPFSPDEDPSLRRHSSFSQRSPFTDFPRDKFPSIGGWNPASHPSNPRQQSIAIPPEQPLPGPEKNISAPEGPKYHWSEWIESPSKRRKISEDTDEDHSSELDKLSIEHYYATIHPLCPILPDISSGGVTQIYSAASPEYARHFSVALKLLPRYRDNSNEPSDKQPDSTDVTSLQSFLRDKSKTEGTIRSHSCELLFLYAILLLLVVFQHDCTLWTDATMTERELVRIALDASEARLRRRSSESELQHGGDWLRAQFVTALFARLYAISHGDADDPVAPSMAQHLAANSNLAPPGLSFLALSADILQYPAAVTFNDSVPRSHTLGLICSRLQTSSIRAYQTASGLSADDSFVQEVRALSDMISMRCHSRIPQPDTYGPVLRLAEVIKTSLKTQADMASGKYLYSPLSFHSLTLATITLLELQKGEHEANQFKKAVVEALEEMKICLSGLNELTTLVKIDTEKKPRFWADALREMIEQRLQTIETNGSGDAKKATDDTPSHMDALLRTGYANIVAGFMSYSMKDTS